MEGPLEIRVVLRNDEVVKDLENQIRRLQAERADLIAQRDRAEYKYRCETIINTELHDLLKAHGIKHRPALTARPWSE